MVVALAVVLFVLNLFEIGITSQVVSDRGFNILSTNTEKVISCSSRQDNYNPYLQGYASTRLSTKIEEERTYAEQFEGIKKDDYCLSRTTLREISCDSNKVLRTTIGECKYGCVTDINGRGYCNKAKTASIARKTTVPY